MDEDLGNRLRPTKNPNLWVVEKLYDIGDLIKAVADLLAKAIEEDGSHNGCKCQFLDVCEYPLNLNEQVAVVECDYHRIIRSKTTALVSDLPLVSVTDNTEPSEGSNSGSNPERATNVATQRIGDEVI